MSTERKPTVIVRHDKDGNVDYMMTEGVDLYIVDENCVSDRVYKYTTPSFQKDIDDLIGNNPIGHLNDGKFSKR